MRPDLLKGLTKEQTEKFRACKTHEEMLKAAKEEGVQLTDEQLEAISGGGACTSIARTCPECGEFFDYDSYGNRWHCNDCGCWWNDDGIIEHGKKYKGQ